MIFGGRIGNCEAHRDPVEKLAFAEIIAGVKNELVLRQPCFR